MAKPSVDIDRAAMILVEAAFFGDVRASEKWGIHKRTVENYRKRLEDDNRLVALFHLKREAFLTDWIETLPVAIRAGTQYLIESFQVANRGDPEVIHAVAGAMKVMAEIGITKEMLDAKLGRLGQDRTEDRQLVTYSSSSPPEDDSP